MKKILSLLIVFLVGCVEPEGELTKNEMIFLYTMFPEKEVVMIDLTRNKEVTVDFDEYLFQMSWLEINQLYGEPRFVFFYQDGNYYPL